MQDELSAVLGLETREMESGVPSPLHQKFYQSIHSGGIVCGMMKQEFDY